MFYNTRQAATKLEISIHTLRRYLNAGWLKAGRLPGGTHYRFTERQIQQAIEFMENGGNSAETSKTIRECGAV
jgi:excisionase family DNA binding protein